MKPVYVARPILPDLTELTGLLEDTWATRIVTNEGPLHNRLESALKERLGVPVAKLFSSGTSALQSAILSLDFPAGSEVITTPLTFPATAHAITASGLKPVFADIDPDTLTIDPGAVERAITPRTVAVVGVHVYGTICDDAALQRLCTAHDLTLIYDAAHAFASRRGGISTAAMGDMSVFSLHATKLYNAIEGGLVTATNPELAKGLSLARNFGIVSEDSVECVGINGKMSELHAAVGLLNLNKFEAEKAYRRRLRDRYNTILDRFAGLRRQVDQPDVEISEQYYMLRVDPEVFGVPSYDVYTRLTAQGIFARRYFSPICTDFECYRDWPVVTTQDSAVVDRVKDTVLCLPFHSGVEPVHVRVIEHVLESCAAITGGAYFRPPMEECLSRG